MIVASRPTWLDRRSLSVLGMGSALPGKPISTDDLLRHVAERFGMDIMRAGRVLARRLQIESRHISRDLHHRVEAPRHGESNAELAAAAVRLALAEAGLAVSDVRYLIAHTATPGQLMPPNVTRVAELLQYDGPFVELRQACTGFANALIFARGLCDAPDAGPVAIVGSETGSAFFDPLRAAEDRGQLVNLLQMGDGAGACVVAPSAAPSVATGGRVSDVYFGQIGRERAPGFKMSAGGSDAPRVERDLLEFEHDYDAVRTAGAALFQCGVAAANALGIELRSVQYIVPHQANGRMAELLAGPLGFARDRIFVNAQRIGNTGSAAIWLALAELRARMRAGERALILGAEATKHMFGGFLYVHA